MVWHNNVVCVQCHARLAALPVERHTETIGPKALAEAERVRAEPAALADAPIRCPSCGSAQLSSGAKGFGGGKALAGGLLVGPVGLLAGTLGAGEVKITCLKCGEVFAPGDTMEKRKSAGRKQKRRLWPGLWRSIMMGLEFLAVVLIFGLVGQWLDHKFRLHGVATLVMICVAVIGDLFSQIKTLLNAQHQRPQR
ncbi:MAG: AtpZ/AtpI family protein [Phycisphaerae bacterium]